jgi:hypothetical protein
MPAAALVAAIIGACTAVGACGRGDPAPHAPATAASNGPLRITGTEKVVWDQLARDAAQLARYRYIAYIDDMPSDLVATCGATQVDGAFPCTAPLPTMLPGLHRLELVVEERDGKGRQSPKSGVLQLDVALK